MSNKAKINWIENLRAIACIMVIVLHVTGPWLHKLRGVSHFVWNTIALMHSFTRFCVPVFVMITGALLLSRKYSFAEFYNTKFSRIVRPLLFWSIFYICIYLLFDWYTGKPISFLFVSKFVLNSIFYGAAYHLWYLYLILSLYLIIPFLSSVIQKLSQSQLATIIIGWFMILTFAQYYESNVLINYIRLAIGYVGYLILGHALLNITLKHKTGILLSVALILLGWASTFFPVFKNYNTNAIVLDQWFYYLNINTVILSTGIFLFLKYVNFEFNLFRSIAKHSFGIYFVHLFYIMLLNKLLVVNALPLVLYLLLFSIGVLTLSYFTIIGLGKFKFISNYIE